MPSNPQQDGARCCPALIPPSISSLRSLCCLLILLPVATGCSLLPSSGTTGFPTPAGDAPLDSLAWTGSDTTELVAIPPDEPPQYAGIVDDGKPSSLTDLETLFQAALAKVGADSMAAAQDDLMALREQFRIFEPAQEDSCTVQRLESLRRRCDLLRAIIVEEEAFAGESCAADLMLAEGYRHLNPQFPDSLVPATGPAMPGIMADLLKWDNPRVDKWLDYFTGRGRRTFTLWLQRKQEVGGLLESILEREGLPPQLVYLAMIESGFSPAARSVVNAVGPWQFMAPTARAQGLRINWWVDEREDYELSTVAAARYLRFLHDTFGDWSLVLAAYNSGENLVLRKISQRANDNYWDLNLPAQTADFVPKFIAAARIGQDPDAYGFAVGEGSALAYDTITVDQPTGLDLVARCAGATTARLAALNPALLRGATPPDLGPYPVHVPAGKGKTTTRALAKVPAAKRLTWTKHKVRRGETLSGIAAHYGCRVSDLARVNHMHDIQLIRPGDQLLIPMPRELDRLARSRAAEKGHYVPPAGYKRVAYTVRRGDTLGGIARKLHVSVTHLRKVNNIHHTSLIHPGDRLFAYRPAR